MADKQVSIRDADESQQSEAVQRAAADVAKILTPNEEILFVALQNITALSIKKDCAVATTNRLILFRPSLLGRVDFDDFPWQDVRNARINQGMLSTELVVETVDGTTYTLAGLDKEQAKRFYAVCQQQEQEWREKRRVREMEEARARAGGIQLGSLPGTSATPSGSPDEDPVEKLARAKKMLDQGLISEAEFDTLKARILSAM